MNRREFLKLIPVGAFSFIFFPCEKVVENLTDRKTDKMGDYEYIRRKILRLEDMPPSPLQRYERDIASVSKIIHRMKK